MTLEKGVEGSRSVAPDDLRGGADARAIDEDAGDTVLGRGTGDRRLRTRRIGDITGQGKPTDLPRGRFGGVRIQVEQSNLGPRRRQTPWPWPRPIPRRRR